MSHSSPFLFPFLVRRWAKLAEQRVFCIPVSKMASSRGKNVWWNGCSSCVSDTRNWLELQLHHSCAKKRQRLICTLHTSLSLSSFVPESLIDYAIQALRLQHHQGRSWAIKSPLFHRHHQSRFARQEISSTGAKKAANNLKVLQSFAIASIKIRFFVNALLVRPCLRAFQAVWPCCI